MSSGYATNLVIAQRIRTQRRALKLSLQTVEMKAGLPRGRLCSYENDKREITVVDLLKIAAAIETTPEKLIDKGRLL